MTTMGWLDRKTLTKTNQQKMSSFERCQPSSNILLGLCKQYRPNSWLSHAQADLSLCWAHMQYGMKCCASAQMSVFPIWHNLFINWSRRDKKKVFHRFSICGPLKFKTWLALCKGKGRIVHWALTHLSLASHKRDIGKQCRPRSDAQNATSDQALHCLH